MHMEVELNPTVHGVLPPLEAPLNASHQHYHHIYITANLGSTAWQWKYKRLTYFSGYLYH